MTDEKRIILAKNKITRLRDELDIAEREGDEDRYENLEKDLDHAVKKLERLEAE